MPDQSAMPHLWYIVKYDELYRPKTSRNEDLVRPEFVKMPIKPRGKGLKRLLKQGNGIAHLGIFLLLVEMATEVRPDFRGKLLNHLDQPASVEEIAECISLDTHVDFVGSALKCLESMGWVACCANYDQGAYGIRTDYVPATHEVRKVQEQVKVKAKAKVKEEAKGGNTPSVKSDYLNLATTHGPTSKTDPEVAADLSRVLKTWMEKSRIDPINVAPDIIRRIEEYVIPHGADLCCEYLSKESFKSPLMALSKIDDDKRQTIAVNPDDAVFNAELERLAKERSQ